MRTLRRVTLVLLLAAGAAAGVLAIVPAAAAEPSPTSTAPAGVTPEGLKVAGESAWMAKADHDGRARYRLEFGVLPVGTVVQVPFAPQNLRVFDQTGRATPLRWFGRMQVRPQMPMDGQVHL